MGIRICPNCGGKVSTSRQDCIHCGYVFPMTKKCPDCEEEIDASAEICPVCGYPFTDEAKKSAQTLPTTAPVATEVSIVQEPTPVQEPAPVQETSVAPAIEKEAAPAPVQQERAEKAKEVVSFGADFSCPYCQGTDLMQTGKGVYMCKRCKGKFLSTSASIQTATTAKATPPVVDSLPVEDAADSQNDGLENQPVSHSDTVEQSSSSIEPIATETPAPTKVVSKEEKTEMPAPTKAVPNDEPTETEQPKATSKKKKIVALVLGGVVAAGIVFGVCYGTLIEPAIRRQGYMDSGQYGEVVKMDNLTSFTIPDGVTEIKDYAFSDCYSLTSIVIPDSVTSIGEYAFYNCDSLTSVVIPDSVTSLDVGAFCSCDGLTSVVIPDSVTCVSACVFAYCESLTIYCEATSQPSGWVSSWNSSNCLVVWNCNNNDVVSDGYIYTVVEGIRYALKNGEAMVARQPISITSAIIPASIIHKGTSYPVTSIGSEAFEGCSSLTEITLPFVGASKDATGYQAVFGYIFGYTTRTSSSAISGATHQYYDSSSSSDYRYYHYYIPVSLKKVTITGGDIGEYAFRNCTSLTSVIIGGSVTSIGSDAFLYCDSLTSIVIPDSVTSIGSSAFYGTSLTKVNYTGTIDSWAQISFGTDSANPLYHANNLYINDVLVTTANITTATKISDYAFYNCDSLTSISIPDGVTSIGYGAFSSCDSLTSVIIPDSVTSIGSSAFDDCDSLTSVIIPDSVTSIGNMAFGFCNSLTIYCEAASKPSGWASYWNDSNRPVVWGYKGN